MEGGNIWDEGPDTEQNIRFSKENPGVVVGATFNKLVERITASGEEHSKVTPSLTLFHVNGPFTTDNTLELGGGGSTF